MISMLCYMQLLRLIHSKNINFLILVEQDACLLTIEASARVYTAEFKA